ncbi:MAG TPA: PIG-L family deacetylase [Candidatus Saccharimonadales bacterium]|nr:PIG-L family deacetylase [Candidatus Saccharimonadales bacterium]
MLKVLHPTLGAKRQIFMLDTCPSMNDAVVTQLPKRSIAVLVNINSTPGKHQCTLEQIVSAYGRPNASVTLVGSLVAPRQVLLFYDNGPGLSGPVQPISPPQAPATVVPTTLSTLPAATCAGKTILSFVAHQDDDLLFMNPDHLHEFRGGDCMRTVYLTAGDAGQRSAYWLGREKGAEAAYDTMMGHGSSLWLERYIMVANHEYIKMATPRGNPNITLVFLHLPDGNVPGSGFARTHNQSLAKLGAGSIGTVDTVDGQSHYTKDELTNLLVRLMQFYHPNQIDTQAPLNAGATGAEHSDHMTTGQLTTSARMLYSQNVPLLYYTGYPISLLLQNVSGQDLVDKTKAFYAYAPHDSLACVNPADCATDGPYATWLMREYRYIPGDPLIAAPGPVAPPPAPPDGDTGSTGPGDGGTPSSH